MRRFSKVLAFSAACSAALILTVRHGGDGIRVGADSQLRAATRAVAGKYDLSQLPSDAARVIARGLQKYGMILSDGGNLYVSATTDVDQVVSTSALRSIKATDFEMIDGGTRINWSDYQCQRTVISN